MKHDVRFAKSILVLNGIVPGALLAWDAVHNQIGANGVNYALHTTGLLAFIFLLLSLLVTPLRKLTGWTTLISFRRSLGLFGFFYASVHFLIFYGFDRALSTTSTVHEILSRRYLQIGTLGLLLLIPLAVTSTNAMVMRLGAKRWKALHRLTYVIATAAAIHYYLLVKSDVRQPVAFAAVLTALLGFRIVRTALDRRGVRRAPPLPSHPEATPPARARFWSGELRVARVFEETPDVRTFRMVPLDAGELPFRHQPGQYLNLTLNIDGKRVNRSYTIASSPTRAHYCEITVKRGPEGPGSWHMHDNVRTGNTLRVAAPAGRFVFTGAESSRVVLIAGGVGITPLMSIVRYLTDRCWPGDIYFVISARRQTDLIFREEIMYLERRFPNLRVCATLSREEEGTSWKEARGTITKDLLTSFVPRLTDAPVYLCGPDGMMTAMRTLLLDLGVADASIRTEAFVSPPAAADSGSPDSSVGAAPDQISAIDEVGMPSEGEGAFVRFQRSGQVAALPSDKTILETAEATGVEIPFECRSGICGQCKTRLLAGRVTMETEDALSVGEKARGFILTCQARSTGNVTIDA
jgi:ferredoxin-NADP reductase/DMSO/TMAO reductase YedYZ heme-binding membrane subunit